MSTATETFSVFLSHSIGSRDEANHIARALVDSGLEVFDSTHVETSPTWNDDLWKALAESDAMIVVADDRQLTSANVAVELGAALAWQKPIFVIRTDDAPSSVTPTFLERLPTYPKTRIEDVVNSIRRQAAPLGALDRAALVEAYQNLGAPIDQLIANPTLVDELTDRFRSLCKSDFTGERLVQELVRMRKRGILPKSPQRS